MTVGSDQVKVLEGLRVVDFCHGGVGPLLTKFLADAGAQVIKVETHQRTEVIRRVTPFKKGVFNVEGSAQFASYNNNKFGITLNLKHPQGLALAKRLVAISDIVTDSFTPGVMDRIGLGYQELKKVKPDIIQISMSFAGRTGPYAHQRGHGPILAALVGVPGLVGWQGERPIAPGSAYTDYYLPQIFLGAVVAALLQRTESGQGQFIDGSDFEGAIDVLGTALLDFAANGREAVRRGNRHEWAAPHGCYPCRGEDRWCVVTVFSDQQWRSLCRVMGSPELASDDRFVSFARRKANEDALDDLIAAWTAGREAEDVMRVLQVEGVPAGVAQNCADTLHDPQLNHRHHFWELPDDPDREWFTYELQGFRLSATPLRIEKRVPRIGEHNHFVFHDVLGIGDDEFAELVASGAID